MHLWIGRALETHVLQNRAVVGHHIVLHMSGPHLHIARDESLIMAGALIPLAQLGGAPGASAMRTETLHHHLNLSQYVDLAAQLIQRHDVHRGAETLNVRYVVRLRL